MAPLSLKCPLCCTQTFSSGVSLKYHLLNVLDKLICPFCSEKFDGIRKMTDHLDQECKESSKSLPFIDSPNSGEFETVGFKGFPSQKTDTNIYQKTILNAEIEDNEQVTTETMEEREANDGSQQNSNNNFEQSEEATENEEIFKYTCQMCNISFNSVQDHLAEYHEGEEVLLEGDDEEEDFEDHESAVMVYEDNSMDSDDHSKTEKQSNKAGKKQKKMLESEKDANLNKSKDSTGETSDDETNQLSSKRKHSQSDSEDNDDGEKPEPKSARYIVENGQVRSLSDAEAAKLKDKSSVICVYTCPGCSLQFPNMNHYQKHKCCHAKPISKLKKYVEVKEELKYQCTFCQAVYSTLIALNDHMKSHLVQDESGMVIKNTVTMSLHVCKVCNTKFPTFKQLRLHYRMHDPVKLKKIDAPVSYNMLGQPKSETEDNKNSEREQFQCPICDKLYDKEYEEVHLKSHEGQDSECCLVCNRHFDSRDSLEMHMKAHSNTKKFACSYCKKPFTNYNALEQHVLKQCVKRQYECQYCGRRFSRPHEKVKHERIHTGEKPHTCQICGKAFRVSYCLTLHMRTHSGSRPYTCTQCGKKFKSHGVYNHHMQTHSDVRNYKCPFCPKAFKTAVQLAGHKNSHTKPFSCKECNRPFATLYAVKAHMETHKRENNLKFDCWMCGASYARSFALRDHMNSVHGDGAITENQQDDGVIVEMESHPEDHEDNQGEYVGDIGEPQILMDSEEHQLGENEEVHILSGHDGEEGQHFVVLQEVGDDNEENHVKIIEAEA